MLSFSRASAPRIRDGELTDTLIACLCARPAPARLVSTCPQYRCVLALTFPGYPGA